MRLNDELVCAGLSCAGVDHAGYRIPAPGLDPAGVRMVLISEAAPRNPADGYCAPGNPLYLATTLQAFRDAGAAVDSLAGLLGLGVYLTTAVKCAKTGYAVPLPAIKECSMLLEREIAQFPDVRAWLLMGDVAIQAVNAIAKRAGEPRVIPAGSTYKIRGAEYQFRGARAFPSYLQAGPSFFIEKSKRQMIAEDIAAALRVAGQAV
jgi:uracil-DNA glycosylase